jgi:hypothetical protein
VSGVVRQEDRSIGAALLVFAVLLSAGVLLVCSVALADEPATGPCAPIDFRLFPADNPWNSDISTLPVDPRSDAFIARIGADTELHADFGTVWDGGPNGIPYNVVRGTQPKVPVTFYYDDESDAGPYPIPLGAQIEHGSDHHLLILDVDNQILYELYDVSCSPSTGAWAAGSGAIWDLKTNAYRPDGWTSADAAGLPMLPGLVRYDEVARGEITHALRFTVPETQRAYIFPASHYASDSTDPDLPPMGLRLRLKASYDISGFSAGDRAILQALKTYGMIVADNGGPWYVSGAPDARWDDSDLHEISAIRGSDFEVVNTSGFAGTPVSIPRLSLGSTARVRARRTFARWARFSDTWGSRWTASVNYGDRSGTKRLSVYSGKRLHLSHRYKKRGTYYVTVKVRNNLGREGRARLKVVVRR